MLPRPNRTLYERSECVREVWAREEDRDAARDREDRAREKSCLADETAELVARVGLS